MQFFISHLASWLRTRRFSEPTFRPSGAANHWENTVNRDFPTFSRICIFFLLTLSLLWSSLFCSSPLWLFPPLLFHLSILSEVWLLNFLRLLWLFIVAIICCCDYLRGYLFVIVYCCDYLLLWLFIVVVIDCCDYCSALVFICAFIYIYIVVIMYCSSWPHFCVTEFRLLNFLWSLYRYIYIYIKYVHIYILCIYIYCIGC